MQRNVKYVKAVDGVSFFINEGETLSLVGESGCGKTTAGKLIIRLLEPTEGKVFFEDQNISNLTKKEFRKVRQFIQIIFQDPYSSLNPRMTVRNIIGEALVTHKLVQGRRDKEEKVLRLLETIGLSSRHLNRHPHALSGGQLQRICIARALAVNPKLIICDEPVSALDVSIQAQVINLMEDLQNRFKISYLFISHDLSVVRHISDRVAVMYLGKIVELGRAEALFKNPKHPYTRALLSAVPISNPNIKKKRILLKGDIPSPVDPPSGCAFHPRCPEKINICATQVPEQKTCGEGHYAYCHLL